MDGNLNNKIFLVGSSEYGPVNTPIHVTSYREAINIFGSKGSLIDACSVLFSSKMNLQIYMVKSTGSHSELYLNINDSSGEVLLDSFYIKSKHANEKNNKIKVSIEDDYLIFSILDGKGSFYKRYALTDDITLHTLVESINEDTRSLKNDVYCYCSCSPSTTAKEGLVGVNSDINYLTGGSSGLIYTKNMIYTSLNTTYSVLTGCEIDIILPLDANFDDTFTDNKEDIKKYYNTTRDYLTIKCDGKYHSFYEQLLKFTINQMSTHNITVGVMKMEKTKSTSINQCEYYEYLKYFKNLNKVEEEYKKYTQLISVTIGDLYYSYGTRVYNTYLIYASILATLTGNLNSTNKQGPNNISLYNTFDTEYLQKYSNLGFVCFRYSKLKKRVVVMNGVTLSDDVNFKYFNNTRMVQIIAKAIKVKLSSLIGEDIFNALKTKKIENTLNNYLKKISQAGYLNGYSLSVIENPISGEAIIDINLKTIDMIESIDLSGGVE